MALPVAAILAALTFAAPASASVILYSQNFENPVGFVNDGGDVNIHRNVNQLYGGQPAGFQFAQNYTVETLLVGGTSAHGGLGFQDPSSKAGNYVLGMLSHAQNDWLGLSFDVGSYKYLNLRLDISGIDLDTWGGYYVPTGGAAPEFQFSLFDNPGGGVGLGSGPALDFFTVTAPFNSSKNVFNWGEALGGLDASGSTNGKVILRIDLLSGGYAAFDNIVIAAGDEAGVIPGVPEPATWAMLIAGFGIVGMAARRRRAAMA